MKEWQKWTLGCLAGFTIPLALVSVCVMATAVAGTTPQVQAVALPPVATIAPPPPTPEPEAWSCEELRGELEGLTSLQLDQFLQGLVGDTLMFEGRVSQVKTNGDVFLSDCLAFPGSVILKGVPDPASLQKDQVTGGYATIRDATNFLGVLLDAEFVGWPQD